MLAGSRASIARTAACAAAEDPSASWQRPRRRRALTVVAAEAAEGRIGDNVGVEVRVWVGPEVEGDAADGDWRLRAD